LSSALARASRLPGSITPSEKRKLTSESERHTSTRPSRPSQEHRAIRPASDESKGYEHFRLAMRSPNVGLFRKRIILAARAYRAAGLGYDWSKEKGRSARCFAWNNYARFHLATKASVKKELLDSSWRLAKQSLEFFSSSGDFLSLSLIHI